MNLFLAASYTNGFCPGQKTFEQLTESEKLIMCNLPNQLDSYHYVHSQKKVDEMRADGAQIFLDSGAFSAWSQGVEIPIDKYCDYIIENRDILRVEDGAVMASVLDGIGDPQKTLENQFYMEAKGAKPLPCFHFGEPLEYLDYYVANYDYITLGGMVGKKVTDLIQWLDGIWSTHLADGSGRARLKVHAFGITAVDVMKRYDWFSVDSSSWIQFALFGGVTTPWGVIPISDQKLSIKEAGKHFDNVSPIEKKALHEYLARNELDPMMMREVYNSRAVQNARFYNELGFEIDSNGPTNKFLVEQQLF